MTAAPRVALALGSGSARGYAHIGVLDVLCERGYRIAGVSGSSMGALIGGVYSAGRLAEFTDWAESLTQSSVLRLLDPSFTASGVLRAGKLLNAVRDMLGDALIEDLAIPYTAVATDLVAGRSVWLQRGKIDEAVRASIAIPGLIAPHVIGGRLLADGGILAPLPMAPIAGVDTDLRVAVDLGSADEIGLAGDHDDRDGADDNGAGGDGTDDNHRRSAEWLNRMVRSASELLDTDAVRSVLDRPTARALLGRFGVADPDDDEKPDTAAGTGAEIDAEIEAEAEHGMLPKLGTLAVMNRSIDIAQAALARQQLALYPPDLVIEVPRTACRGLDFHRAAEMIALGRELTTKALDAYESRHPGVETGR